jgi:hypothetical protein
MPGGVCAVLDYEVDAMAEYVAEMATRVVTPDSTVTSPFRKFVSQILTSTRLPRTTILLGMNYLAKRMNALKSQGAYKATEGQVWRYLTVSLLLGSILITRIIPSRTQRRPFLTFMALFY